MDRRIGAVGLTIGMTLAVAAPALAQDSEAPPAVQAFLDNIERQTKVKPTFESLETDGDGNVTIANLSISKEGAAGAEEARVGDSLGIGPKAVIAVA